MSDTPQNLTAVEARILGVLIEKEKTTPDVYPLTLNSLTAGCNQKTSRDPVMQLGEMEIARTLEELRRRGLATDAYGASGRVLRHAHSFNKVYKLPSPTVALLATLMLRGPQTVSELRTNCERLHSFVDNSSVEAYLEELANRADGPMAIKLPKQAGSREHRWAHLLCGELAVPTLPVRETAVPHSAMAELEDRVGLLELEVEELKKALNKLIA